MNTLISLLALSLIANPGDKTEIRGWLGIEVDNLSTAVRNALNTDYGVMVVYVSRESPAEKGGLEVGDVILDFNGEKIFEREDLEYLIRRNPDKKVVLTVLRKSEKKRLTMEVGSMEYEDYWIKIPALRFPEDLERALRSLKPKWDEEMDNMKREMKRLERQVDSLRKELEKKTKL